MRTLLDVLSASLEARYRVEGPLGAGGSAHVFVADDLKWNRRVAIKVLREELALTVSAERFLAEIKTTAQLRHTNIVPLLDWGAIEGLPYYVMPLLDGESVRARLNRLGALGISEALHVVGQVGAALDHAHERGIIHRDVKPENVILGSGQALVLDFGISTALDPVDRPRWTLPGWIPGTPGYMSPEQVSGEPDIDGRTDVYSLACVAYEMICGYPPFAGSVNCVIYHQATQEAPSLVDRYPDVPLGISAAIARGMAKSPGDRFGTPGELVRALRGEAHVLATTAPRCGMRPFAPMNTLLFSRP